MCWSGWLAMEVGGGAEGEPPPIFMNKLPATQWSPSHRDPSIGPRLVFPGLAGGAAAGTGWNLIGQRPSMRETEDLADELGLPSAPGLRHRGLQVRSDRVHAERQLLRDLDHREVLA